MKTIKTLSYLIIASILFSCSKEDKSTIMTIKNSLDFERTFEIIEIQKSSLNVDDFNAVGIKNKKTGELEVTQLVDVSTKNSSKF